MNWHKGGFDALYDNTLCPANEKIYPFLDTEMNRLTTVENLAVAPGLQKLYGYLVDNGNIRALEAYTAEHLTMFSPDALKVRIFQMKQ